MSNNINKINKILENEFNESTLVHFLTLVRKELETLDDSNRNSLEVLKFYCDWSLHSTISRSKPGSSVIVDINKIIRILYNLPNNDGLISAVSTILLLNFKSQLLKFLRDRLINTDFIQSGNEWKNFLRLLLLNIEGVDVSLSKMDKTWLASNPVIPGLWIEKITIIQADFSPLPYYINKKLFSLDLLTCKTTRIIIPLTPV